MDDWIFLSRGTPQNTTIHEWSVSNDNTNFIQNDVNQSMYQLLDAAQGRPLPPLEFLQPTLDNDLPNYQAKPKESLKGHYKVATSDILPGLVKGWISDFKLVSRESKLVEAVIPIFQVINFLSW